MKQELLLINRGTEKLHNIFSKVIYLEKLKNCFVLENNEITNLLSFIWK